MNKFIIVFFSMLITVLFAKYLTSDKNQEDVILNFDNEKIKCKCDIGNSSDKVKENFTNYTNNIIIEKPPLNENIITSIGFLDEPKRNNITAQAYYQTHFKYPLEPIDVNNYDVYPINEYKYLNIGNDTDKLII